MEVLCGGEQTLRTHRPWILCEMHSEANDCAVASFCSRSDTILRVSTAIIFWPPHRESEECNASP
jgi:hypothetical protein